MVNSDFKTLNVILLEKRLRTSVLCRYMHMYNLYHIFVNMKVQTVAPITKLSTKYWHFLPEMFCIIL